MSQDMSQDDRSRIEDVVAYIDENLDTKLDLEALASRTHWSKFHFGRVFAAATGTTPIAYVNRKRLEKSVRELLNTDLPILEIALRSGYETASAYNACFKKHYGTTPSQVRQRGRNNRVPNRFLKRLWDMNITVCELPEMNLACFRHVGSYLDTWKAWKELNSWTFRRGLNAPENRYVGISLDDPSVVDEEACRYDACVSLPEGFSVTDEDEAAGIRYRIMKGGLYAVYPFYDSIDRLGLAYHSLYAQWLPNSEYEADKRECLEMMLNDPSRDAEGKARVKLYVPVRARTSV